MQSMTGYGTGRATLGDGSIVLDLKAVNHRFFDVRVRLPSRIQSRSHAVERVARKRLRRGRIDISARLEGRPLPQAVLDKDRARAVFGELVALRDELTPDEAVPLSVLSSVPDLFVMNQSIDEEELEQALEQATAAGCEAVETMRTVEGVALGKELETHLDTMGRIVTTLREAAPELIENRRTRVRDRLETLLGGTDVELEPTRLEQEIAILADRSDITEELARLQSHQAQMLELIQNSDAPVGKRIDFLLQEMAREANTIGAKSQSGSITSEIIDLKASVEQMREQAQNVL